MQPVESRPARLVHRNRGGLFLINTSGIRFGDGVIQPEILLEDRQRWGSTSLLTGINNHQLQDTDEVVLRKALCELTPFMVIGRPSGPMLVLQAELRRFSYAVDGQQGYEEFGVRLMPVTGEIDHVILSDNPHGIKIREESSEVISVDVGQRVHAELYLKEQDLHFLASLTPPTGFNEHVVVSGESYLYQ